MQVFALQAKENSNWYWPNNRFKVKQPDLGTTSQSATSLAFVSAVESPTKRTILTVYSAIYFIRTIISSITGPRS